MGRNLAVTSTEDIHRFNVKRMEREIEFTIPRITLDYIDANINSISPQELFWNYAKYGFFYPSKRRKLTPYINTVEDNWEKALSMQDDIFWIACVKKREVGSWASICNCRSTLYGWVSQHLVSHGRTVYPLLLMLATQAHVIDQAGPKKYESFQNWYRPTNKYANKVFGALGQHIGGINSDTLNYDYLTWTKIADVVPHPGISVVNLKNADWQDVAGFLGRTRSSVYLDAEEYRNFDIELLELNKIYQKAGLSRRRFFWAAVEDSTNKIVALAIVNRAPIGLNFSMLENRTEFIYDEQIEAAQAQLATLGLLQKIHQNYNPFEPNFIPLVATPNDSKHLVNCGATNVRMYNQFIWKKDGYQDWYDGLLNISKNAIYRWHEDEPDTGNVF